MNKKDFDKAEPGDTVECLKSFRHCPQKGWKGTVVGSVKNEFYLFLAVCWKESFTSGHNCNDLCDRGYGRNYFVGEDEDGESQDIKILRLIKKEKQLDLFGENND